MLVTPLTSVALNAGGNDLHPGRSYRSNYYKEYSSLKFDVVRSPQQQEGWNRLTEMTLSRGVLGKPFLLHEKSKDQSDPLIVIIQLQHIPRNIPDG